MTAQRDILATLAYFDLFDYPLTQTEIFLFLGNHYEQETYLPALQHLTLEGWIHKFEDFYSLQNDPSLIRRRRKGNLQAKKMLERAEKIAGFLSLFPFVRGVAVSGSLSKNYADEHSDIDFFIITAPNRLWLARTFMHLFKKLTFLFNRQDWFCMNYYIDEKQLQIREKNLYTAIEVATLLPLRGIRVFQDFFGRNPWMRTYLPNHTLRISYVKETKTPAWKKLAELFLLNALGKWLEHRLMQITAKRWKQKKANRKLNARGFVMGMDAGPHHAKPDPENFQHKLLALYEQKIFTLFRRFESRVNSTY